MNDQMSYWYRENISSEIRKWIKVRRHDIKNSPLFSTKSYSCNGDEVNQEDDPFLHRRSTYFLL